MAAGHKVHRHDHRAVISGMTNLLAQKIKQDKIGLMISDFPAKGWHYQWLLSLWTEYFVQVVPRMKRA